MSDCILAGLGFLCLIFVLASRDPPNTYHTGLFTVTVVPR
jgi:hypothetical protein